LAPWRDLLQLSFDWRIAVVTVGGQRAGVSLSVLYNNHWHYMITGVNFKNWPGLGKYLVKANMEEAMSLGADIFDAGLGDCGWKHIWHFDKIPQYEFRKES
jgi:CelD/BcsL family acetyltransferase involved in cellulose biosynthesis